MSLNTSCAIDIQRNEGIVIACVKHKWFFPTLVKYSNSGNITSTRTDHLASSKPSSAEVMHYSCGKTQLLKNTSHICLFSKAWRRQRLSESREGRQDVS